MTTAALDPLPGRQSQAIRRMAERHADLVVDFLTLWQATTGQEVPTLSPAFLLQLGAILQLHAWERQGMTFHLEAGLPSSASACDQVREQFNQALPVPLSLKHLTRCFDSS